MSVVTDKFAEIEKLDKMRRMGLLSEKDFELQKKVLLNQISHSSGQGTTQSSDIYVVPQYSFKEANIRFWRRWLDWRGRSTPAEYWYPLVGIILFALCYMLIMALIFGSSFSEKEEIIEFIFIGIIIIPCITCTIRRIHDTGRSAKIILWSLIVDLICIFLLLLSIPLVSILATLVMNISGTVIGAIAFVYTLLPSQPHKNIYDPDFFD